MGGDSVTVRVVLTADDPVWLMAAAARHAGVLSDHVLTSLPGQQDVIFPDPDAAALFKADLRTDGRYRYIE